MKSVAPHEAPEPSVSPTETPLSVPELWERYFLLRDQRPNVPMARRGESERPLERIANFLRLKDRRSLGEYLNSVTPDAAHTIRLDPVEASIEAHRIDITGSAIPATEIRLQCAGSEHRTRTSPADGRFEFPRVQLAPGNNQILIHLPETAASPERLYGLWRSALERIYGEQAPTWRTGVNAHSFEIEFLLPFAGRRDPITGEPLLPENFNEIVRCPTCHNYTRSESWRGQCPMVELDHQCTNHSVRQYTFEDDGFYPALDS